MATTELIESDHGLLNELKVDLVHRITEIDDLETIKEVFVCLQQHAPKNPYILSPEDEAALKQGRKDYAEGRWIDHDDFMAELEQWRVKKQKK